MQPDCRLSASRCANSRVRRYLANASTALGLDGKAAKILEAKADPSAPKARAAAEREGRRKESEGIRRNQKDAAVQREGRKTPKTVRAGGARPHSQRTAKAAPSDEDPAADGALGLTPVRVGGGRRRRKPIEEEVHDELRRL